VLDRSAGSAVRRGARTRATRGDAAFARDAATWPVALVAIVLLAAVTRSIGLNGGLWIDEIYSLVRSFRAPLSEILTEFWGDNHHPLYAVLAHGSRAIFGESPWTVRLPAMLLGVAAVPVLYRLGLLVARQREALLAALLLSVNYHHVWFSQNARGYSAIAFVALVTMWAMLRAVETGRTRYFVWYAIAAALGAYTHLTTIFVVVGHALALLVYLVMPAQAEARRTLWRGGVLAFVLAAALTLLLYAPMLQQVLDFFLHRPSALRGVSTPRWAFVETIRVLVLGLGAGMAVVGATVVAAGAVVGVSGLVSFWARNRLFVLMLVMPCLVTIAGAAAARGTMYPRFFFFAIGPAMLLAVRGAYASCAWLAHRAGRAALGEPVATSGIVAVTLLSAASLSFDYRYPKQDFEGAMRHVLAEQKPGDAVVTTGLPADPYRMLYGQRWENVSTASELDAVRRRSARTWVVWTFPRYLELHAPEVDRVLRDACTDRRTFRGTVGGGDVLVCTLPAIDASAVSPSGTPLPAVPTQ
jgi:4-amino-4-deoxy-L-arabinose transferase-like glycosyltransferase